MSVYTAVGTLTTPASDSWLLGGDMSIEIDCISSVGRSHVIKKQK